MKIKKDYNNVRYDFVLFENYIHTINHYKDVCIIAMLLQQSGYSVAIADLFQEAEYCHVNGVPHVPIGSKATRLFDVKWCKIRVLRGALNVFYEKTVIPLYLRYALRRLEGKYNNLYVGSYHTDMPIGWLKEIPSSSSVFFWGLRSSRLIEHKLNPNGKDAKNSARLRRYIDINTNIKFFVSDEIIRDEFLNLGIDESRIVIRPERYVNKVEIKERETQQEGLSLLSIGTIRKEKRIECVIDALADLKDESIHYTIAGKADDSYENVIEPRYHEVQGLRRLNYRIPEEEYNLLFKQCDFLILCDMKQPSSVTNGTMNEALLKGIPIIAPDYNPYKFFIEKYGIGILFKPNDKQSLCDAILKAKRLGSGHYHNNILAYQKTLLLDNILPCFSDQLNKTLINN